MTVRGTYEVVQNLLAIDRGGGGVYRRGEQREGRTM